MDDQTRTTHDCDVVDDSGPFAALDLIHTHLRHAVEDRDYLKVQELIARQRAVFELAGHHHPEARQHALAGRDLAAWALTMVRLQRAHDQRALTEVGIFKKASESYEPETVYRLDYLAEG